MTNYLFEAVNNQLNAFPSENEISKTMGPSLILQRRQEPDYSNRNVLLVHMFWCIMALQKTLNQGAYW